MKKIFMKCLAVVLACATLAFTFFACGDNGAQNGTSTGGTNREQNSEDGFESSSPHEHKYTTRITRPTCTEEGFTTHTCKCGESYIDTYVNALGHQWNSGVETEKATCNKDGNKLFTCMKCNDSYIEQYSMVEYTASEIYERTKNSVGEIITYDKSGAEYALGTGFTYSTDGKIITNYHVIEDAYSAKITIDGMTYSIKSILAYDRQMDIAILKIDAKNLTLIDICTNEHAVGEAVYAFGSSKGLTATFSQGIITYADREIDGVHYVQHDAAISSGNSGGPLINQHGEIIGINTMTIKDSQNLNFAISAKELSNLVYGTPLTVAEFYEKECDVFTKLKNYIIQTGAYDSSDNEYDLTLGYAYSDDYTSRYTRKASYDVAKDEIDLMLFIDADYLVSITIDEVDGIYGWSYIDSSDYFMMGTLYANTYTSSTLLGYSYNNISYSSLRSSVRKLASSMVSLLCFYINSDYQSIGITATDLGFIYF